MRRDIEIRLLVFGKKKKKKEQSYISTLGMWLWASELDMYPHLRPWILKFIWKNEY